MICLDVLRALGGRPETLDAFLAECRLAAGADRASTRGSPSWSADLRDPDEARRARRLVERMALALQGSLLVRHGDPPSPTRSARHASAATAASPTARCPPGVDAAAIVERHRPRI